MDPLIRDVHTRLRPPDTEILRLSRGSWLRVKKHLTAGEQRQVLRGSTKRVICLDGVEREQVDPIQAPLAQAVAYLLDWSLVDGEGAPLGIAGLTDAQMLQILDLLPPDDCDEVVRAIDRHDDAMRTLRAAEKKASDGEPTWSATSPSLASSAGATSGSPSLMPTSMPS